MACTLHHDDDDDDDEPEGKRQPGRPRLRWENNIRMDFRDVRWKGVNWMHLA